MAAPKIASSLPLASYKYSDYSYDSPAGTSPVRRSMVLNGVTNLGRLNNGDDAPA